MQNEVTNLMQEKLVNNRHLADSLRRRLLQPRGRAKQGYGPEDTFSRILAMISNEQLVAKYLAHTAQAHLPVEVL